MSEDVEITEASSQQLTTATEETNETSNDKKQTDELRASFSGLYRKENEDDDQEIQPCTELPDIPPIRPFSDPPPVVADTLRQFRPMNWRGLMAAIQSEPVDPVQLGKDIFEETQGVDAKYKCILNGLSGKPFRLDLETLYQRRLELVEKLGGDEDFLVQLYDFNLGCIVKMDMDRRAFNNITNLVNQNVFFKTVSIGKIPKAYKFDLRHVREMLFFTPLDADEYESTNTAEILNTVGSMELDNQEEIVKQIALRTYALCIKPIFMGKMTTTQEQGKIMFADEFYTFLKRMLYQSFGVPYHKFEGLKISTLSSGLPNGDYPYERAAAVILIKLAIEALKEVCARDADRLTISKDLAKEKVVNSERPKEASIESVPKQAASVEQQKEASNDSEQQTDGDISDTASKKRAASRRPRGRPKKQRLRNDSEKSE